MVYTTAAEDGPLTLEDYQHSGRTVFEQVLRLSGEQKIEVERRCMVAIDPENRDYRYDYYRDNCSTRVRDLLDGTLRGRIKQQTESKPSGVTYRWHTRRLLSDDIPLYVALQAVLGHPVDEPISQWQEMFLPEKLRERLREITVVLPDGSRAPLLESESVLGKGDKPPEASAPPHSIPPSLLAGVLLGGAFVGSTLQIVRRRLWARVAFVVLGMAWLLLIGIGGAVSTWGWVATDHFVSKYNENLLHVTPLGLVLLVLLPAASGGGRRMAFVVSAIIAGLSLLGLVLKVTPFFFQVNGDMIALCLPVHLALCWSLWRLWTLPPRVKAESPDARRSHRNVRRRSTRASVPKQLRREIASLLFSIPTMRLLQTSIVLGLSGCLLAGCGRINLRIQMPASRHCRPTSRHRLPRRMFLSIPLWRKRRGNRSRVAAIDQSNRHATGACPGGGEGPGRGGARAGGDRGTVSTGADPPICRGPDRGGIAA